MASIISMVLRPALDLIFLKIAEYIKQQVRYKEIEDKNRALREQQEKAESDVERKKSVSDHARSW